jgi:formyltetrahydrofolate synthetase
MNQYRNDNIDKQMNELSILMSAIVEKDHKQLDVMKIFREGDNLTIEEAVHLGMQINAREAFIVMSVVARGFDRVVALTEQIIATLETEGNSKAHLYNKRLELLLRFNKIAKELSPPESVILRRNITDEFNDDSDDD